MSEWRDRHLGVSAISQKCVMSELIHGVSVASASAVHISKKASNCESMVRFEKRGDSKPCRTAVTGAYPKDTHGQTHTLSFRKISIKASILLIFKKKAKSVCDHKETSDLLSCKMDTHEARKATCEKVQVCATVRARKLCIPQGAMC